MKNYNASPNLVYPTVTSTTLFRYPKVDQQSTSKRSTFLPSSLALLFGKVVVLYRKMETTQVAEKVTSTQLQKEAPLPHITTWAQQSQLPCCFMFSCILFFRASTWWKTCFNSEAERCQCFAFFIFKVMLLWHKILIKIWIRFDVGSFLCDVSYVLKYPVRRFWRLMLKNKTRKSGSPVVLLAAKPHSSCHVQLQPFLAIFVRFLSVNAKRKSFAELSAITELPTLLAVKAH